jgi:uncharacterized membrane protein YfcA
LPELILLVIGVLVGMISAMIGLGGGFLVVPILIYFFNVEAHQAIGTSLVMIIFTGLSATFAYWRQKRVDFLVGILLTIGTVPGAVLGAYLTTLVTARVLTALFGVFLVILALQFTRKDYVISPKTGLHRLLVDSKGVEFDYSARVVPGLILSFVAGVVSGFFGIGGGAVMVPVMMMVVGLPMHIAVAVSAFIMVFTSISGALTHLTLGNVITEYALYLSLGIVCGTQIGAAMARRLSTSMLQRVFAASLVVVGLRMILDLL